MHFSGLKHMAVLLKSAPLWGLCVLAFHTGCSQKSGPEEQPKKASAALAFATPQALGQALFFDVNLSKNRTQSCATCHDPSHAFIDPRENQNGTTGAFSLGDDGVSLGDRNTPTAAYAGFSPVFGVASHSRFNSQQGDYTGFVGGQFWDGREPDLPGQASGPPLNPIEMAMPDEAAVMARLQENPAYVAALKAHYGADVFASPETAYSAVTQALAAFEATELFQPFDSIYDRSLRGEYTYDPLSKAARGKALFFSQQFTNCATCHQLQPNGHRQETFSNYEYHNIGVPANLADRLLHKKTPDFTDAGLQQNPAADSPDNAGKFKVPTLRNVAVTGPYMHNGVFKELRTVIAFYDHFLQGSSHTVNPETGEPWAEPAIEATVAYNELRDGRALNAEEVESLVCFLRTLTDQRYEHLIPDDGLECGI